MDDEKVRALQEEARRLEARQAATERSRDEAAVEVPPAPRSAEGFAATLTLFTGMQASSFGWLLGMGTLLLVIGAGILADGGPLDADGEKLALLLTFGTMGLSSWFFFALAFVRWLGFRGWRSRLPFALSGGGWEKVATDREENRWHESRLEIVLGDAPAAVRDAAQAMLRIFCVRANKSQFRPQFGSITAWKANGLTATGDVGGRVGWKLYRFIAAELPALKAVKEVRFTVQRSHDVTPHDSSS